MLKKAEQRLRAVLRADALFTVDTAGKTTAVEFVAGNFDASRIC